jgi:hypothetical protein
MLRKIFRTVCVGLTGMGLYAAVLFLHAPVEAQQGGGFPVAVKNITCTAGGACSLTGMKVGQTATIFKPSATSRNTTTTLANDPDLQFTNMPAGAYWIEGSIRYSSQAAVGIKYYLINNNASCTGSMTGDMTAMDQNGSSLVSDIAVNNGVVAGAGVHFVFQGSVNSPGSFSLCWAQNTSSATATLVSATSSLVLQRID